MSFIQEGCPEFIYLFYGDRKIASLLVKKGDHITVSADTLGFYTVDGSEESILLQEVENDYAQFITDMSRLVNAEDADQELSRRYVDYYRRSIRYVMERNTWAWNWSSPRPTSAATSISTRSMSSN